MCIFWEQSVKLGLFRDHWEFVILIKRQMQIDFYISDSMHQYSALGL